MNERTWVELMAERLRPTLDRSLEVHTRFKLAYAYEITDYDESPTSKPASKPASKPLKYETDLIVIERETAGTWKPRVVVEAKIRITTHGAITYNQKASSHKAVHPYLRYGIMLGSRGHYPLPGRLYRHGGQFDFMISFVRFEPTEEEMDKFTRLVAAEIKASRTLEKIIYESRKKDRDRYTVLHRKLVVE